jgi:shikimate kinase
MIVTIGGFMGTGKSTVGKELAIRMGWPFFDLDDLVEQACVEHHSLTISGLIAASREHDFRATESEVATRWIGTASQPCILALGGGSLHNESLGSFIETHSTLFVLNAPWNWVEERIMSSDRPLKRDAHVLFELRKSGYNRGTPVNVNCRSISSIVDELESLVRSHEC